jgi:hypothetical protein
MCVCVYVCVCLCKCCRVCKCMCACVCKCVCMCVYVCVCVCVLQCVEYVCICVRKHSQHLNNTYITSATPCVTHPILSPHTIPYNPYPYSPSICTSLQRGQLLATEKVYREAREAKLKRVCRGRLPRVDDREIACRQRAGQR